MTKTLESEVSTMCNLSKGVEEKGIEKGILFQLKPYGDNGMVCRTGDGWFEDS